MHIGQPFVKFLRDINGNYIANNNYTGNPTEFFIEPPLKTEWIINQFFTHMLLPVNAGDKLNWDDFGNIPELTNGYTIQVYSNGAVVNELTDRILIKKNFDFLHFGEIQYDEFRQQYLSVRLYSDWASTSEHRVHLDGNHLDKLSIIVSDDFSGLLNIHWMCWGWEPEPDA
jgi:hypothetical protein